MFGSEIYKFNNFKIYINFIDDFILILYNIFINNFINNI